MHLGSVMLAELFTMAFGHYLKKDNPEYHNLSSIEILICQSLKSILEFFKFLKVIYTFLKVDLRDK